MVPRLLDQESVVVEGHEHHARLAVHGVDLPAVHTSDDLVDAIFGLVADDIRNLAIVQMIYEGARTEKDVRDFLANAARRVEATRKAFQENMDSLYFRIRKSGIERFEQLR